MLFRLTSADFETANTEPRNHESGIDTLPRVTLNDLTPEEWAIVTMARESIGLHGCVLPEESPLARLCSAPEPRPPQEAFKRAPGTRPAKRPGK